MDKEVQKASSGLISLGILNEDCLSQKERDIFRMRFINGLPLAQIASTLNLTFEDLEKNIENLSRNLRKNGGR